MSLHLLLKLLLGVTSLANTHRVKLYSPLSLLYHKTRLTLRGVWRVKQEESVNREGLIYLKELFVLLDSSFQTYAMLGAIWKAISKLIISHYDPIWFSNTGKQIYTWSLAWKLPFNIMLPASVT